MQKGGTSTASDKYGSCTVQLDEYSFEFTNNGSTASIDFKYVKVTVTNTSVTEYGRKYGHQPKDTNIVLYINILDKTSNIVLLEQEPFYSFADAYVGHSYSNKGNKITFGFSSSKAPYSMILTNHYSS